MAKCLLIIITLGSLALATGCERDSIPIMQAMNSEVETPRQPVSLEGTPRTGRGMATGNMTPHREQDVEVETESSAPVKEEIITD